MDYERYHYSEPSYTDNYGLGENQYGGSQNSYSDGSKNNKEKKDHSLLKKIGLLAGGGALFGLCAGAVIFFITEFVYFDDGKLAIGREEKKQIEESVESDTTPIVQNNGVVSTGKNGITTVVTDITEVVDKVMPSVVSITNEFTEVTSFFGQNFKNESQASGSGIILGQNDQELLIVTNYHVVAEADKLNVQFINGKCNEAQLKGADSNMDLAVIAVLLNDLEAETREAISIASMGDSSALHVGEPAIAIGNALGYGQSVTTGVISALDRQIEMSEDGSVSGKLIQTDAAINPGNSGGALLNVHGEVIGINSNKIGGGYVEGMGYAIPISSAQPIIENLMSKETKSKVSEKDKGYLGITGLNVTQEVSEMYGLPKGVFVTQVYEGTAAEQAGILKGDIIVNFDGSSLGSMADLQGYLQYYKVGDEAEVTVMRASNGKYEEEKLTVKLGPSFSIDN